MLEGHSARDIDHAARHYWPRVNLEKIKGEIYDELALVAAADPDTLTGWCLEAYRELYRRMISTGDYSGAIRAVREIQNLIG